MKTKPVVALSPGDRVVEDGAERVVKAVIPGKDGRRRGYKVLYQDGGRSPLVAATAVVDVVGAT